MSKSKPLVFFGTENFSAPALQSLLDSGWNIELVVTKPDSKKGRGQTYVPAVKVLAEKYSIKVLQPTNLSQLTESLDHLNVDYGVLVAYGRIIPNQVLDKFKSIINIHPSLLPKYRGASPIEQAILNGDDYTGISLMKLAPEMDAGDIYIQDKIKLKGNETKPDLYNSLSRKGARLLVENLEQIMSGGVAAKKQEGEISYAPMISKSEGWINWQRSATEIEREIRAFLGWPGSKTKINDKQITITKAMVIDESGPVGDIVLEDKIKFYASVGAIEVLELTPEGRKNMTAAEFLRGL